MLRQKHFKRYKQQVTGCANWEAAVERYPHFTTADILEPFKSLDFSVPKKAFCQHAINAPINNEQEPNEHFDQDKLFRILQSKVIGIMWKTAMETVDPVSVKDCLANSNVPGFGLSIFDLEESTQVNCKCINVSTLSLSTICNRCTRLIMAIAP